MSLFLGYTDRQNFGRALYPANEIGAITPDSEAINFLNIVGITDITQQTAIINLVGSLKNFGLWSKLRAIYPFVGGTAATHKWNLKDPQDTDAAHRMVFTGGWTHSSTGALPNGTNGYADTKCIDTNFSNDNISFGVYSRTNQNAAIFDYGIYSSGTNNGSWMALRYSSIGYGGGVQQGTPDIFVASTDSRGLFAMTKNGNNTVIGTWNGGEVINGIRTTKTGTGLSFFLAALNNTGPAFGYSSKEFAFAFIGSGLSNVNMQDLYRVVQAYQTTLGRQV